MNLSKATFHLTLAVLVFGYGVAVGRYEVFPYAIMDYIKNSLSVVLGNSGALTGIRPDQHIYPEHPRPPADLADGGMTSGYTAVTGFFDDGMEIRLLDGKGRAVHRWPVSFSEIWPDATHIEPESDRPKSDWNMYFNGIAVLMNGDVVFPYHGLIKIDSCSNVIWKVPSMIHHSVEISPRGTFWTPGSMYKRGRTDHLPFQGDYHEHTVVEVSSAGKILREISILNVLRENSMIGLLSSNNASYRLNKTVDIVHINDVEEIPVDFLPAFPMFDAGDLLISLRDPNLLIVMAPDTREIKWHQVGPWNQQHDPDWQPDGTISVFSNNPDKTPFGSVLGGSRILSFDPQSGETVTLYGGSNSQHFYSEVQGDHQILENGNILIVASTAGRVFEVTQEGELVWEFFNRYREGEVVLTSDGVRYSEDELSISGWDCAFKSD